MPRRLADDLWIPVAQPTGLNGLHLVHTVAPLESMTLATWRADSRFVGVLKSELVGIPSLLAATSGQDLDLVVESAGPSEAVNARRSEDTATVYDWTGLDGRISTLAVLDPLFVNVQAGDWISVQVIHTNTGGPVDYLGLRWCFDRY